MTNPRQSPIRLSLGPVQYFWSAERLRAFYDRAAASAVDIVYLGEVVCAKRRLLDREAWLEIAEHLQSAGKEVVLSTLTLLEAASELGALRRTCRNGDYPVEANDMSAVYELSRNNQSFVGGPGLNIYNRRALEVMMGLGMDRWVPPVELPAGSLGEVLRQRPASLEVEVFAWGRMPLAYSARCYTARAAGLRKDRCDFVCLEDPDGRLLRTQDGAPFLVINGIQTQSASTQCLAGHYRAMTEMGVDVLRLSPQAERTFEVVEVFDRLRNARVEPHEATSALRPLAPVGVCDGYWTGTAGMIDSRSLPPATVEDRR